MLLIPPWGKNTENKTGEAWDTLWSSLFFIRFQLYPAAWPCTYLSFHRKCLLLSDHFAYVSLWLIHVFHVEYYKRPSAMYGFWEPNKIKTSMQYKRLMASEKSLSQIHKNNLVAVIIRPVGVKINIGQIWEVHKGNKRHKSLYFYRSQLIFCVNSVLSHTLSPQFSQTLVS